ncbi:MAG: non-canonical purine NTP pyrophosphatase [Bacillota bacterium]|nr:MAG: non-canonical purine NTP pyrophosphatase [Bacillota bacterium]
MRKLVVATRNRKKWQELAALLADLPVEVLGLDAFPGAPEVEETGETFADNARLKAVAAARHTGHWAIADDSGLEVDALGGRPGVYSARFAGPGATDAANNELLLKLLDGVPPEKRRARFRCAIAIASPSGETWVDEGVCEGIITDAPRGDGGFGYDPLFLVPELGKTFAEMGETVKNRISHRARALSLARERLMRLWRLPEGKSVL